MEPKRNRKKRLSCDALGAGCGCGATVVVEGGAGELGAEGSLKDERGWEAGGELDGVGMLSLVDSLLTTRLRRASSLPRCQPTSRPPLMLSRLSASSSISLFANAS